MSAQSMDDQRALRSGQEPESIRGRWIAGSLGTALGATVPFAPPAGADDTFIVDLMQVGSRCDRCQLRRPRGRRWRRTREAAFALYGRKSVHCGEPTVDIDHVVPIADGGSDDLVTCDPPAPAATAAGVTDFVSLCMESAPF